MSTIELSCTCGAVHGIASHITPQSGTRLVCYCDDCQAFATFLERENQILDPYGGTELFQMPLAYVQITAGIEQVRCMRLSEKGMHRWYTECCKTPIGNTLTAGIPFIGLIKAFVSDTSAYEKAAGPIRGYWLTKFATNNLPEERKSPWAFLVVVRSVPLLILWKLRGLTTPTSFFRSDGQPISQPIILK